MLHGDEGKFAMAEQLLKVIVSPLTITLIHVDSRSTALKTKVGNWILANNKQKSVAHRVVLMKDSLDVAWGTGKMIHVQLRGFFELLDLAKDWENIINLSGSHYPLRSPEYINSYLVNHPGRLWIDHARDHDTEVSRLSRLIVWNRDKTQFFFMDPLKRTFPWADTFKPRKQSQWMILPRQFIEHLRIDSKAHMLLAWCEHDWVPDEHFFIMAANNREDQWWRQTMKVNKQYVSPFQNGWHPMWINDQFLSSLKEMSQKDEIFFARKIDIIKEKRIKRFMDDQRKLFDKKLTGK